ncbi:MAG: phosphate signaling complex protein PhoU [Gemmatimonadota bacterium]|nr:phosphate signaling complex protein PhoU [Gemmatimonadota bacterium]
MSLHLQKEVEKLKRKILSVSALVEESVYRAAIAVQEQDAALAEKVIEADFEIDQMEIEVEEDCLKILALHQPVAADLRFIVAVMKINNDLERIGDLAANIAERAVFTATQRKKDIPFDFTTMAAKAQLMLRKSLDALVNMDTAQAREVLPLDDEVDTINRQMFELVKKNVRKRKEDIELLLHLLMISRHLERIADHATNIAEDVIYMAEGEIVRHKTEHYE